VLDAHIVKARPRFTVDVTVRVESGEACGLFGVSGSGKSTVLACIAGAEEPDDGHVTLGAGSVSQLAPMILEELQARQGIAGLPESIATTLHSE